ncbi:guanine nucleotide binding protein (G protein), alpha activating activity polypeptide, olfactory type 2 [Danio aesculapii]|uniref:guanine nucleotide binding protein (G protein), alpha activating activity polypeptide, olfactory type 2 n=1 Tax=Danio aesculapii TaxID=1142201 RepID=UPI0024C062F9|nr:guanine nucleotide binding protein (G protein), alpha activating activity polypeptide, olfactory type 2 [Danio aesculapii]
MGLCYSLRPRLFGNLSGSISNANSESDHQPPDAGMMMMPSCVRGSRQRDEDSGGNDGKTSPTSPLRTGDAGKVPAGELRRGDADRALIQNGGGGGGKRRLPLLQTPSSAQKHKNWDKLVVVEEKEAEKEAKKVSKNIDRALKELKREYKQTHRLLLLGE